MPQASQVRIEDWLDLKLDIRLDCLLAISLVGIAS